MFYKTTVRYYIFLLVIGGIMPCLSAQDLSHEGHFARHHVAVFTGLATNLSHPHTAFSAGAEYEFRFLNKLGAGILGEILFAEEKEMVLGLSILAHPAGGFKILAAPLLVLQEVAGDDPSAGWHKEAGFRAGAAYDFHVGKCSIGPAVNADFIAGATTLTYGVAFGLGF